MNRCHRGSLSLIRVLRCCSSGSVPADGGAEVQRGRGAAADDPVHGGEVRTRRRVQLGAGRDGGGRNAQGSAAHRQARRQPQWSVFRL